MFFFLMLIFDSHKYFSRTIINKFFTMMSGHDTGNNPKVEVEYCGACDYGGYCLALAKIIKDNTPSATISCKRGRQGSFEVTINNTLIYSKLRTMALPDYEEVAKIVNDVSLGGIPTEIKGEQPINCSIS